MSLLRIISDFIWKHQAWYKDLKYTVRCNSMMYMNYERNPYALRTFFLSSLERR